MKITISGAVGSGKSTISKLLAEKMGLKHYSVGSLMREIAQKRGMDINELSKIAETDKTIDSELDLRQRQIGKEDNFVMDSRLGFHFIPDSFKVFLTVDIKEAARRIYDASRKEESYADIDEAVEKLKRRMKSENIRYKEYYNIDFPQKKFFDLVLDTTNLTPDEVVDELLLKINPRHTG